MIKRHITVGSLVGAIIVTAMVAPAFGAQDTSRRFGLSERPSVNRSITTFTPASADPKLAALLVRSGLRDSDFRFTPSESRFNNSRAVTVAVRARASTVSRGAQRIGAVDIDQGASLGLAPIAYNLGVSVGWKRFALAGEVSRLDLGALPNSRESAAVGLTYSGKRASAGIRATALRPFGESSRLVSEDRSVALDVGGSYSLSRNIDLTAGLRYKREDNYRLDRLADNRRDSQAVYIGTALRF